MSRWEAILFLAALIFPFPFFWVVLRKWPRFGAALLAVYVLSYLPFTLVGKYVIANHGGSDWRREWVPKYLVVAYPGLAGREKTTFTPGGAMYWPCIVLDHLVWHQTSNGDIFDDAKSSAQKTLSHLSARSGRLTMAKWRLGPGRHRILA